MSNKRALNDYTANLSESAKVRKEMNFTEPKKVVFNPSSGNPMEPMKKKSNYVIAK